MWINRLLTIILISVPVSHNFGQSLEIMAGHQGLFGDVQWLKFVDEGRHFSIFSRTRATIGYDGTSDVFSGAYINYSLSSGIGASLVGKAGNGSAGLDAGIHLFKASPDWMFFGLMSIGVKNEAEYSWFSILRFTPGLTGEIRLYSSLELFSLIMENAHSVSIQRIRLGVDVWQFQAGIAGNFTESGKDWTSTSNIGGFIRKSF